MTRSPFCRPGELRCRDGSLFLFLFQMAGIKTRGRLPKGACLSLPKNRFGKNLAGFSPRAAEMTLLTKNAVSACLKN